MIYNATRTKIQREAVTDYIKRKGYKRVVDIGGSLGPWANEVVTYYFDLQKPTVEDRIWIPGDLDNVKMWEEIRASKLAPFDFIICTQCIEHLCNPSVALTYMPFLAREGFLEVPNKFIELRKGVACSEEGLQRWGIKQLTRGFVPHRWIFTIREEKLWCWPKLPLVEQLEGLEWADDPSVGSEALSFLWRGHIPHHVVNDTALDFPDGESVCKLYRDELIIGL